MPGENALALVAAQPDVDLFKPMKSLAELQMATSHAALYGAQAKFQIMRQNALAEASQRKSAGDANWIEPIMMVDPAAAKTMQETEFTGRSQRAENKAGEQLNAGDVAGAEKTINPFAALREKYASIYETQMKGQQGQLTLQADVVGKGSAKFIEAFESGAPPERLRVLFNQELAAAKKAGVITEQEYNFRYDKPDITYARQAQAWSLGAKDAINTVGKRATAEAEGKLPSELTQIGAKGVQERKTQGEKVVRVPPTDSLTTGEKIGATGTAGQPLQLSEMTPEQRAAEEVKNRQQMQEKITTGDIGADLPQLVVPSKPLTSEAQPGMLHTGQDPATIKAKEASVADYEKNVKEPGIAAYGQKANLNELESLLKGGKVLSGAAADKREQLAGYIYTLMGGGKEGTEADKRAQEIAKKWTGIDVSDQAVFGKITTQMGLQYARQTEGAREAVQAIRIALGANPRTENAAEANLKIVRLMKAANQFTIDKMQYANDYFQKNGHYLGASEEFTKQRPQEVYTSRASPFHVPRDSHGNPDTTRLQPNVEYTAKDRTGKTIYFIWDGKKPYPVSAPGQ